MMKRIFLHIGWSKTATTTIQAGLELNKANLKEQGFLIPEAGFNQGQHHNLAYQLLGIQDHHYFHPKYGTLDELGEEIKHSSIPNVVISSEIFHNANPDQVHKLHRLISPLGTVKILVFLRSPEQYLESMWIELVKKGMYKSNFDQYLEEKLIGYIYLDILDRWAEVFGDQNILLRIFDKKNAAKHVFGVFLESLGVSHFNAIEIPGSRNISPSVREFELVRMLYQNIRIDHYPKIIPGYFILNKIRAFAKEKGWDNQTRVHILDQKRVDTIWDKFSDEDEIIANKFFGKESIFTKPVLLPQKSVFSLDDLDKVEMLELFGFLTTEMLTEIKRSGQE